MSEGATTIRLSKAAREFNIGVSTVVDFLLKKGFTVEKDPNSKLSQEMYTLLMKEFATEKHVKEEAKKIGLHFIQHETITIDDKRLTSKDKEKELDEPLYIKNAALEYNTKLFDTQKKVPELPLKEVPKEEKKQEAPPIKEPPKPVKEPDRTKTPAEAVTPVAKEVTAAETAKKKSAKTAKKKTEKEVVETAKPVEEPGAGSEKIPEKKSRGIKIVGKLDMDTVKRKSSKKGKGKKEKVKEPVEELSTEIIEGEPVESVTETPIVIAEEPGIIEELLEEIPKVEDNFLPR